MREGYRVIVDEACRLAERLPRSLIEQTASLLIEHGDSSRDSLQRRVLQAVPGAGSRGLLGGFLDTWHTEAAEVAPACVAAALLTAAQAEANRREHQSVELVWTGPDGGATPLRRTEQAILQVIDSAAQRLLVVSYAVFKIPRICDSLVRAAKRGVMLTVVLEAPDWQAGRDAYDTLSALGSEVAAHSTVYVWPPEQRARDENGRAGLLHVKCAAADGHWLFLSSANLTEYAFTLNMEFGVLIGGGRPAELVEEHFHRLIQRGILTKP